jgi:YbbR domain-containing protein
MVYHPFRHLGLKFLSVAVAVGLWFTVAGEQTAERSLRVPLELTGSLEQLGLVEAPPENIDVRVRGASGLLSTLSAGDVIAIVNLSRAKEGLNFFYLTPANVQAPFGVEVVEVNPPNVPLRFERLTTRTVPIVPHIEGEPAPGYVRGEVSIEPTEVEVTGPETAMRRLKEATTEPVSLEGRRAQVREVVTIGVLDANVRVKAPATAVVTVPIQPEQADRRLVQLPVHSLNVGSGLSAQAAPAVVAVVVRGPKALVEALSADSVTAFVDLAGKGRGRYNLSVQVELSPHFEVVRTEPATVQVRVR